MQPLCWHPYHPCRPLATTSIPISAQLIRSRPYTPFRIRDVIRPFISVQTLVVPEIMVLRTIQRAFIKHHLFPSDEARIGNVLAFHVLLERLNFYTWLLINA